MVRFLPMRARLPLLACALVLGLAGPAAAHDGEAVPLPDEVVGGVTVDLHGDRIPDGADMLLSRAGARRAMSRVVALDPAGEQLADTWCGQPTSTDNTLDAATGPGASIKLIYARPNDVADQFATRAHLIQQDARDISNSFANAADGTKTVRFDVGTPCGPWYVDILSVTLPRARSAYTTVDLNTRVNRLQADLGSAVAGISGAHDYLVYGEGLNAGDGVSGVATLYADDRAGSVNASNRAGQFAFVLGFGSSRRTTAQHELGHNLGAVQNSAPHSTQAGHCFENYDVMCYADGGPKGRVADMTYPSACTSSAQPAWDCDADDYFHPAPPASSYLATHWNLYDSVYLCAPAQCIDADGSAAPSSASALPPASGGGGSGGGGGGSGGSGGSGSGGSGSGGSGASTPTTPTTPTQPSPPQTILPRPAGSAASSTAADVVRAALDGAEASFTRTLAGAGGVQALRAGRPVHVRVTSPSSGVLVARLTLRGRTVVRTTRAVRAGMAATVTLRASTTALRSLRSARASALALRLSLRSG